MRQPNYEYYKRIFASLPKPLAYVDVDLLQENIAAIAPRSLGKRIRIASKSVRCRAVLRRILDAGPPCQGIMSYTAAEAIFLADHGFDDILLGYPIWNAGRIADILRRVGEGKTITCMVDSLDHLRQIERVAKDVGVRALVCIDVDMSTEFPGLHFGVRRSPLSTAADVEPLLLHVAASNSLQLDGIMGYEAQVAGVGDHVPGQAVKNRVVHFLKTRSIPQIAERRAAVVELIRKMKLPLRFVNGGGTGSLHTTSQEEVVTEITVGSGFFSPGLFDNYRSFRYLPAAGFVLEIVRQPRPDIFTCAGGGYTASGSPGWDKVPKPYLPVGLSLLPNEAAGEVQTPFRYRGETRLALGDPILMRHAKAGELCERFAVLHAISDGRIVDVWPTYRGDGQCFL
ncbi:amino acid deaminase/aldolase [Alicyclobacillus cycloheptanicus]|uniref:D-serine deaminase-like pyridoxal phosphate-dependent protein n=1 Tax=Alicyclobacillus cycloheptanicus TaxID=1457 RepID=A0ABT9XM57_9BACL|nr:amino acid deaminase/aldolase [Alicyclobacillus cycloheptanicus]MDQ0191210.1 D-serine deaminase-like pyridoxal phosphate-dependent protein [Alicyclobacillus cycloheptanicus]WDM02121.1 amino acid deaminase/aldolase [Alicyclobacillus cycloheptanicus]